MEENNQNQNVDISQNTNSDKEPKKSSRFSFWFETFKFIVISLLIVIPFRYFIAQPFVVSGASMDPTFEDGEYLIVDEISYRFEEPKRGDVIVFKYPENKKKYFIKRIIGLPEETVTISNGIVTITKKDGSKETLKEQYVQNIKKDYFSKILKKEEYFVMGDNRANSLDSRSWGALPEDLIVGKPFVRLLPIGRMDLFPGIVRNK